MGETREYFVIEWRLWRVMITVVLCEDDPIHDDLKEDLWGMDMYTPESRQHYIPASRMILTHYTFHRDRAYNNIVNNTAFSYDV